MSDAETTARLPSWCAPLLSPEELGAADRFAIDGGTPGFTLMRRAAAALAESALRALPAGPIVVLCGPGNNGGDGLLAAGLLHKRGRDVRVALTRAADGYRGDAALARDVCPLPLEAFSVAVLDGAAGAIDALLGTGARGTPHGVEAAAIEALVASGLPVVACDLPSGIDATTGEVLGVAVSAVETVTFHRPSPGHLVHPAKRHVGRLRVADIGIPAAAPVAPAIGVIRDVVLRQLATRSAVSHKYNAGAVLVVGGGERYPGAALLSVRGAQRAGAGYVTAFTAPSSMQLVRAGTPEVIVAGWPDDPVHALVELLRSRADAVVVGPGLGDGPVTADLVDGVLHSVAPVVLDADAIGTAARRPESLRRPAPLVLTPHAGELGRLLARSSAEISAGRLTAAREAAERSGGIVVLKGDDTIVAAPGGRVAINDLAAPALATAGTGDVLAGVIGALLAAGADPFLAACAGVRLHARAGRLAALRVGSVDGVVALDVADALPAARGAIA